MPAVIAGWWPKLRDSLTMRRRGSRIAASIKIESDAAVDPSSMKTTSYSSFHAREALPMRSSNRGRTGASLWTGMTSEIMCGLDDYGEFITRARLARSDADEL